MDLGPSDHQFNTRFNRDLSDGRRLRFNRAFDDSPSNMCLRKEASIKIGRAKKTENVGPRRGIVAHFKRVIVAIQPALHQIERSTIFAGKSL